MTLLSELEFVGIFRIKDFLRMMDVSRGIPYRKKVGQPIMSTHNGNITNCLRALIDFLNTFMLS